MQTKMVGRTGQEGFTLVEALIAIVILVFGLMAITNLYAVAGSSNTVANHGTAAVAKATERMELLKAANFENLNPGGNVDENAPGYFIEEAVEGVGLIRTRWLIVTIPGDAQVKYIVVRSESTGSITGARSRAEFTTFRSCTVEENSVCPPAS
jgi:competence protein ComGC